MKVIRQQYINPKGDCGQCCVATLANKNVQDIYDIMGRVDGISYFTMISLLKSLDFIYDKSLPHIDAWRDDEEWQAYGRPGWMMSLEWMEHAYTHKMKGMIGIALVNFHARAFEDEFFDHWMLVTDVKYESEGLYQKKNVFVSCPTRGEFELNVKEFLKYHGGYNTIWVLPKKQ